MPDWKTEIRNRLASLKLEATREAEIIEELSQHLEDRYAELRSRGMSEGQATAIALEELSHSDALARGLKRVERTVPTEPPVWGAERRNLVGALAQDIRFALRTLRKDPGFTVVAVITLALGIGANTAIFSVINTVLLKPLPYRQPQQLVTLSESRGADRATDASYPDFLDWRAQANSLRPLAGYGMGAFTFTGGGSPETLLATRVTANFFATLGVKPALGRDFVAGEDGPNGAKVVILSHKFWVERFGSSPGAVGQTVRLDGEIFSIIGVLPEEFEFAPSDSPPLWVPLNPDPQYAFRRNLRWLRVIGRLGQDVSFPRAFAEMQAINARLSAAYPQENGAVRVVMGSLREQIVGRIRPLLLILSGAVSFVLLIACGNIASLLLARGLSRKKEIAIRMALGAGRARLLQQFLTESVLLALGGGALGLVGSQWFVRLMLASVPKAQLEIMPYLRSVRMEMPVLAFTFLAAVAAGIMFGLAPALQMSRVEVNDNLKEQTRGTAGRRTSRLRDAFVTAEIGLALVLLVSAGLMLRSMAALLNTNPGFRMENLLTFSIDLPSTSYKDDPSALRFEKNFTEQVRNLPGVLGVATVSRLPLTGSGNTVRFVFEGRPTARGQEDECNIRTITGGYFDVMKIPLIEGRLFEPADTTETPRKAIVNQAFARQYGRSEDPVGKRIRFTYSSQNPFIEIVGVVGNENADQLDEAMSPIIYTSFEQNPDGYFNCVVRTSEKAEELITPIRGVLRAEDPELPLIEPQTMVQMVAQSSAIFMRRFPSHLIGSFAALALTLAMIGLYGLISFSVAQRRHEFGIRMALGAARGDLLRLVVHRGLVLALAGTSAGLIGVLAVTRFLSSLLFGVKPLDPATLAAVSLLLAVVVLPASYIPARGATMVDPMVALRNE
ncbi:MAG TPA: ABC transporter permease [Acidobacteriota bacterium]|nr:ABC transporter permease [Acidobacteriota bacterium]